MDHKELTRRSKFLSLVLRHDPAKIGIALDEAGWIEVEALLSALRQHNHSMTRDQLDEVVASNSKKRFAFSDDGSRIRASQGHSIDVELGYTPTTPPEILYHGTARQHIDSIRREGINKGRRHAVHLSSAQETALSVGGRHGKPVILIVRAGDMHRAGHRFELSANGVWLVEFVPGEFIVFPE